MASRRVLLVAVSDDFLDGLASWLLRTPGLEVVGRAHSGLEVMDRVERLSPELVLMDISLEDMSGFEVARRLKTRRPAPLVMLMTFHESCAADNAAFAAGADGCVSKSDITGRLLPAIRKLLGSSGEPEAAGKAEDGMDRTSRKRRTHEIQDTVEEG